ncbi:uncharacterized protein K02A2.6-like [Planococcus citri]
MYLHDDDDIQELHTLNDGSEKIMTSIRIDNIERKLECDTGSRRTVVSYNFFKQLNLQKPIMHDNTVLKDYTGNLFKPLGYVNVSVKYKDKEINSRLYFTERSESSVMGREWSIPLGIIKVDETDDVKFLGKSNVPDMDKIKKEFASVFSDEIGKVPNYTTSFELNENSKPIYMKARKVPHEVTSSADACINRLIKFGVLEKVDVSEWGTSSVYVEKSDGSVRLCGNYKKTINKMIKDIRYQLTTVEDIFNKLENGTYYCKLDLRDAFLHLPVDEETAKLQTIVTHRGTFRVKRLYYGSKVAPKLFQRFIDQVIRDLPGTVAYFDDLLVQGSTIEECEARLRALLQRLQEYNLHVNEKKCKFFVTEVSYLGHVINKNGLHKAPSKIEAIVKAPRPTNADEVMQFLGLVNYYQRFIKNSSHILYPLNQLRRKNAKFEWTPECEKSFNKIKQIITSDEVLTPYNRELPLYLATDASPYGISAVLSHRINGDERPIAYASRSLTKAEKNYSQLDREALAVYWGAKKFFYYIYGRPFTFIVDNKPIHHILNPDKELPSFTASRVIRYAVFLSQFNYKIEHRPASQHSNADYLSRFPLPIENTNVVDECYFIQSSKIDQVTSSSPITHSQLKEETLKDSSLSKLLKELQSGTNSEPEFSLNDGIIFKNGRIYVPEILREKILAELHDTHIGIVKMKAIARKFVWWPKIDSEIESIVKSCQNCADRNKNPKKAPLHKWEPPQENFQRIHIDYAGPFQNHFYFIIIDSKSKWLEVYIKKTAPTTQSTITYLQDFTARFGSPDELVSDNASIFTAAEFKEFLQFHGIKHRLIAPGHPATNGQAERAVQIVKSKLKKAEPTTDTQMLRNLVSSILRKYRITPLENGQTPSQLVFQKDINTRLNLLLPKNANPPSQKSNLKVKTFKLGERVQSRNYTSSSLWKYGVIVEKLGKLHYLVELDDGYIIKRHVDQLRSTEVEKFKKAVQFSSEVKHPKSNLSAQQQPNSEPDSSKKVEKVLRRSNRSRKAPERLNYNF